MPHSLTFPASGRGGIRGSDTCSRGRSFACHGGRGGDGMRDQRCRRRDDGAREPGQAERETRDSVEGMPTNFEARQPTFPDTFSTTTECHNQFVSGHHVRVPRPFHRLSPCGWRRDTTPYLYLLHSILPKQEQSDVDFASHGRDVSHIACMLVWSPAIQRVTALLYMQQSIWPLASAMFILNLQRSQRKTCCVQSVQDCC